MKEGWTYKRLGDLCRIRTGKLDANAADDDGLYPFFTCSVTPLRINKYAYDCECVLVAGNGDLNVKYYSGKFNAYQRTYIIESNDKNVLDVRYLYMFLSEYVTILRKKSIGAIIKYIKLGYLTEAKLLLPPISEQQSIFEYLDSAFAKIDAMKANAEKALNEAKALFQASLKEMLEPKEGWEEKTLDDVCEIKSILVDPKEVQYKNLLHVGGANIVSETGELIDLKTAAEEELSSGKFTFNDKDVLYNKIRPYLIKVSRPDFSGLCSADMYPLTSKKGMTRDYLYYILVSRDFTDYAIMNSARAGMPKLNRQTLFAYKCMIPPLSEQQSIVTALDSLKSKVDHLQENYNKISQECDALKQAILRQVFE